MATGWTIEIGYNSGSSMSEADDLWATLKNSGRIWQINPISIRDEAKEYGAPDECDGERLIDYCEVYKQEWKAGGPLMIDDEGKCLHIMASGGDPSRMMKEHVARAFCRIIIRDMHHKGIEVNLTVF